MKKDSAELHQLVTNLTLSEKRYCTLYLKKHSTETGNRYLKLFNLLNTQQSYNSVQALKITGYQNKPGHFAVLKKQLYEQLLDALHQYDLFTNPEQKLLRSIHQCHLLMQKGLFNASEKRMKSLMKDAAEMNHYEALMQLQNLKMISYARKYYRQVTDSDLTQWRNETQQILNDLTTTSDYRYNSSRVYRMQYETGGRGKELALRMKNIIDTPAFNNEKTATTLRALLDYYQVKALYHFTNLETNKAEQYNAKFLQLLDENPLLMQLHADRYFSVLNNYLIDCLILKKYDTLEEGLVKMRSLPQMPAFRRLVNFEANVFRLGYLLELNYRFATGNFTEAYKAIKPITAGIKLYGEKIVKHNRITLQYLMAYVCFALGKYNDALDHLWPILQEPETAVAEEVQLAARMMQLLCRFEKGETILLDSLIKSIRRTLLKKDDTYDLQRAVLTFINTSLRNSTISNKQWEDLYKKADKLAQRKTAAANLNLFNYLIWIKAHCLKQSFAELWVND